MKRSIKTPIVLLVMAIMYFTSCDTNVNNELDSREELFRSHADAAFLVNNTTDERLVAFKGSVAHSNLLGGIPDRARNHGIRRNPALFNGEMEFPVIFVTEEQFDENMNDLGILNDQFFSRIRVSYGHDGPPSMHIIVQGGWRHTLRVHNRTGVDLELRNQELHNQDVDTWEILDRIPRQTESADIYIHDGDFFVVPVFSFFNPVHDMYHRMPAMRANGDFWYMPFGFLPYPAPPQIREFDVQTAWDGVRDDIVLGATWIDFHNQTDTAISVWKGYEPHESAPGATLFAPDSTMTVVIRMERIDGYEICGSDLNFGVGSQTRRASVTCDDGNTVFPLRTDRRYSVFITGSHLDDNLEAIINITDAQDVDFTVFLQ